MNEEELLTRIQQRGHMYGPDESRRAVCAVVEAMGEFLSPRSFRLLAEQLPDGIRRRLVRPAAAARPRILPTCRTFLSRIATRLLVDGPNAAFTARVVLEQLNATRRVITPAAFAHLVAADLRPLLCARPALQTLADQFRPPRRTIRVPATFRPGQTAAPIAAPLAAQAPLSAEGALTAQAAVPATTRTPVPASNQSPVPVTTRTTAAVPAATSPVPSRLPGAVPPSVPGRAPNAVEAPVPVPSKNRPRSSVA